MYFSRTYLGKPFTQQQWQHRRHIYFNRQCMLQCWASQHLDDKMAKRHNTPRGRTVVCGNHCSQDLHDVPDSLGAKGYESLEKDKAARENSTWRRPGKPELGLRQLTVMYHSQGPSTASVPALIHQRPLAYVCLFYHFSLNELRIKACHKLNQAALQNFCSPV